MELSFTHHNWWPLVSIRVVFPKGCTHPHLGKRKSEGTAVPMFADNLPDVKKLSPRSPQF
jgi:hypothetical protein